MACAPYPVALNIGNVTLSNGRVARGIDVEIGNPPQHFAFMPKTFYNTTHVYGGNPYCGLSSLACTTLRGGQYLDQSSSSSVAEVNSAAAGGPPVESALFANSTWVQDTLVLAENVTLPAFPLAIAGKNVDNEYEPQTGFGLDVNSTIITTLKTTGRIVSRTWSFFWGETGAGVTAGIGSNGTLVLGGYDAAKVQGDNLTLPLNFKDPACGSGLLVSITGLSMVYPNTTAASLFDGPLQTLEACLRPGATNLMSLPYTYYQKFEAISQTTANAERSVGVNFYGMLFPTTSSYYGDLKFQINSVLEITIKNSQLIQPDVSIGDDGFLVASSSTNELFINSLPPGATEDGQSTALGLARQFFSAAMLMVNQDAGTFTLWLAKPSSDQDLIAIDPRGEPVDTFCSSTPKSTTVSNSTGPSNTSSSHQPDPKPTPIGAIAGGAVGGVVVLCVIAGILYLLRRNRRAKARARAANAQSQLVGESFADHAGQGPLPYTKHHELPYKPYGSELGHGASFHELGGRDPAELAS